VGQEGASSVERLQARAGAGIELNGVVRRFSSGGQVVTALGGVSLSIAPGALVAISGPSGSGKSTLLHLIGAMDRPDDGQIRVGGWNVTKLSRAQQVAYRRRIGFVFQRFHLLSALTALDNVAVPLLPLSTDFDKYARAAELLKAVGLSGRDRSLPWELSGGQQQRVAIARALVNEPCLLIADEPTGNLDSQTGSEIIELLLQLRDRHGMTILLATHDAVVASRCDRVVRLLDGGVLDDVLIERSAPDAVLERISRMES
jgi:putative ABC transport system ATP-binding protein